MDKLLLKHLPISKTSPPRRGQESSRILKIDLEHVFACNFHFFCGLRSPFKTWKRKANRQSKSILGDFYDSGSPKSRVLLLLGRYLDRGCSIFRKWFSKKQPTFQFFLKIASRSCIVSPNRFWQLFMENVENDFRFVTVATDVFPLFWKCFLEITKTRFRKCNLAAI